MEHNNPGVCVETKLEPVVMKSTGDIIFRSVTAHNASVARLVISDLKIATNSERV
jgi:hypothetical protein